MLTPSGYGRPVAIGPRPRWLRFATVTDRASRLVLLMRVEAVGGVDAGHWRIGGRALSPEEAEVVRTATSEDFADAAALLRADAEIDLAGANEFSREATIRDVLGSLTSKLATRMAPRPAQELVNDLDLPEGERDRVLRMLEA